MKILGIGQCAWDTLSLVESFPQPDDKQEILALQEQGGGPVATALVAAAKLGARAAFFGLTGDDEAGERIRQSFIESGVDVSGLLRRRGGKSQVAFIVVEQGSGRRTIFWKRPEGPDGAELSVKDLDGLRFSSQLKGAGFLLLDGMMRDVSIFAAKEARAAGVPIMVDAGRMRDGMLELASLADYLVASEVFARQVGWKDDPDDFMRIFQKLGSKVATFTFGSSGSYTYTAEKWFFTPAFKVKTADTTGAGDVFHGAYAWAVLEKYSLEETVAFASAAAALKCTKIGGRAGIPSCDEVLAFTKGQK
jgi:sulfofructose kinase